jgi:hypothetical protein
VIVTMAPSTSHRIFPLTLSLHSLFDHYQIILFPAFQNRFLEPLKVAEIVPSAGTHRLPYYAPQTAVWLFLREKNDLEEIEQEDLAAFRLASPLLTTLSLLVEDFLQMLRHRAGHR